MSAFMFNFIVWCTAAWSQTEARKDVMEKIPWSLKQQTILGKKSKKTQPPLHPSACIYLPFHAPCIFEDGWADQYEKQ